MTTSLEHLPANRQQQLMAITKIVHTAIHPEKIILFGMYTPSAGGSALYDDPSFPPFLVSYDLLVVTRRGDRRYDYEVQDIVENRCHFSTAVNVLVHDIDYVNEQMSAGHYFFSFVLREAILLYDAGTIPLTEGRQPDLALIRALAEKDFQRWWLRATAFLKNALFSKQQQEPKIAAFLLHQAAEQAYQAILLAFTGYKPCTHNLDKLRRYTNRFALELGLLFPRNTPEEDQLFKILLQGYVDARYKEEYAITEEQLDRLIERIGRLLSIATRVCRNRFLSLEKMAAGV